MNKKYFLSVMLCLSITLSMRAQQVPVANFSSNISGGCTPIVVSFTDLSTGNPTAWLWNFGNGVTSTLRNPSTTYLTPGSYTVSLTVTNLNGSHTITRQQFITAYAFPIVNFSASETRGCFPLRVQFTDQSIGGNSGSIVSWNWSFGNGSTSTQQHPVATYTASGTYSVTLRVKNDKGCTQTLSRQAFIVVTEGVDAAFTNSRPSVCAAPATVSFTNLSTGTGTLSHRWDFGDGGSSTSTSPQHTYTANGNYTVQLITTNNNGCVDTAKTLISIGNINTNFTAPERACANSAVVFTNTSSATPVSSHWNFGDGRTSTAKNPTHTFTAPGTYRVKLLNIYASCSDSIARTIEIAEKPKAKFQASATLGCMIPFTTNFQSQSGTDATTWLWNFGDGETSTEQNPTHTYTRLGNYRVTLIVSNSAGCSDTLSIPNYIKISNPSVVINGLPVRGCVPYTIKPTATVSASENITNWLWNFGDGNTSTVQNPTYTYTTQGTYSVTLTATSASGCKVTKTINNAVTVGTKPAVNFSGTPTQQCAEKPVQFTDLTVSSPQVTEWLWLFGDGGTSILQNPLYTYIDTGRFNVTLIASNNGCSDTLKRNNYVRIFPPIANYTYTVNCGTRKEVQFTDKSIGALTWEWDFGDGSPKATVPSPKHTYANYGTYIVRLTVTNGNCSYTSRQTIVLTDPDPDFRANKTIACKTASINFSTTNITPAHIVSYRWDFGDGNARNVTSPNVSHTYSKTGTFTVKLVTIDVNGCRDTIVKPNYIRINGPIAAFAATNTKGCIGLTTGFNDLSTTDGLNNIASWKWEYGDGKTETLTKPPFQHSYTTPGDHSVKLVVTDAAGCMDSTNSPNFIHINNPKAGFSSKDTLSCPRAAVLFVNSSSPAGLAYSWSFGDGSKATSVSPSTAYTNTGVYTVSLSVKDELGCTDTLIREKYIHVGMPVAEFEVANLTTSCVPVEIQFTNTSTYATSYSWQFGLLGNSTLPNPVQFFTLPGVYPVHLIATSAGGCKDTAVHEVTVHDVAKATISYAPLLGCYPYQVQLKATTSGPVQNYVWDFGDGVTIASNSDTINHTYFDFGNFVPRLILKDPAGCSLPVLGIDTIRVFGAKANFGPTPINFCDEGVVLFTDSTTSNDPVISYIWNFGDGGISTEKQPSHHYTRPGLYDISLQVETVNGCKDTASFSAVRVARSPEIAILGNVEICAGQTLDHRGEMLFRDSSAIAWSWDFFSQHNYYIQDPPALVYNDAGNFTIKASAINSFGCSDTAVVNIVVHPKPTVTLPESITIVNGHSDTIPAIYSGDARSWAWSPSLWLNCTNCPNPIVRPDFSQDYLVRVATQKGCISFGQIRVVAVCDKYNLFIPNTFTPNGDGSNDVFYPRGEGLFRIKTLRIFNRWGEVVFANQEFPPNDAASGWDGMYKGMKASPDVYIYQAEVYCDNGQLILLNGNIALIL